MASWRRDVERAKPVREDLIREAQDDQTMISGLTVQNPPLYVPQVPQQAPNGNPGLFGLFWMLVNSCLQMSPDLSEARNRN